MRAQLNRECRLLLQTFNVGQSIEVMIISSEEVNDEDRNWKGFVANITNQINVINKEAKGKFDSTINSMRAKVDK
jgi:hypothetical protein